jgi:hypothetical protein
MKGSLNALETTLKVLLGFPNIVRLPQRLPEMSREPSRTPGKRKEGEKTNIYILYIYIIYILYIYILCFPQAREGPSIFFSF